MRNTILALVGSMAFSLPVGAQSLDLLSSTDNLLDSLGTLIGCDLSARLKTDMPVEPLFSDTSGVCELQQPNGSATYYSDQLCTEQVLFFDTGQQQFCAGLLDKQQLGNGAFSIDGWTLSPGTRYDIGVESLTGLKQPYRAGVAYRSVNTQGGECELEMRVYRNEFSSANAMPLIAFHGGSWKARGFGALGIETLAAHYTNKGFVVFAPFYRLLSDSEPDVPCQLATIGEIVEDAENALQWVVQNATQYGAVGKPVVTGQSAGAHLALSLAVNKSEEVKAALLMYPPTDFADFVRLAATGQYTNEEGLNVLLGVLQTDAETADISLSPIPENSFPNLIEQSDKVFPPMTIFHGLADELVPASQSMRLCNALAGRELDTQFGTDDLLQTTVDCGPDSELYLFTEANHVLDVCLPGGELFNAVCPSGSEASRQLIASAFNDATEKLRSVTDEADATGGGSGGGSVSWVLLVFVCGLLCNPVFVRSRLATRHDRSDFV